MSSSPLVSCQSISKSFGTQCLFSDLSLGFFEGERLGLIGPNGSGKSTLLKILAAEETPSSGSISCKRNLNLVAVSQDDQLDPQATVLDTLFYLKAEDMENWEANPQLRALISPMGFTDLEQKVETLSGGWRKRLAIAQALIAQPDLLFLDEPTNHLDLEGILWLEALLNRATFAFVLVTHDRFFLENTSNRIIELNKRYAEGFIKVEGSYSTFLEKREATINEGMKHEQALSSKVRRELEWLSRGPKARTTKAKYRVDNAAVLQEDLKTLKARNAQNRSAGIQFQSTDRKTKKLLEVKKLGIERGGLTLFQDLNFVLSPGQCLGMIGSNGSGKSTLIHLLNGELKPDTGHIKKADGLKTVTFGQKREQLDQNQSLKRALCPSGDQVIYHDKPVHVVSWAKRFLFTEPQLALPVSRLSGGEQARLLIANLILQPADLLLLDEPTNDLDIPTLEVLEESLAEFPGALVLITHDRYLLDRLSDTLLSLEGEGHTAFYADIYQWQAGRNQKKGKKPTPKKASSSKEKLDQNPTSTLSNEASTRKLSYEERKELSRLEGKIEKATTALATVQSKLNDPANQSDAERLMTLSQELHTAEEKVNDLYRRWEALEARKD